MLVALLLGALLSAGCGVGVGAAPSYNRRTLPVDRRPLQDGPRDHVGKPEVQIESQPGLLESDAIGVDALLSGYITVCFECPPGDDVCLNGGHGLTITYREKALPLCTCLCPQQFNSPQCGNSIDER